MVNEFDQSVRPEYVSNRIELPFRELAGIAANQQKSFDEGRAIEDDLGLLGQAIKAAPMYEGHRQAFIKEYQSKIKDLTGNGNINYADPEFKRKASMLVNEFKSRPEINAFANTLKSYQDWEGQVKSPDNAMNLDFTYKKDKDGNFNQLDVNKQGVYSPTFTKFEDYNETGKKIMGDIASDGSLRESGYDFSKPGNTRINNGETEVFNSRTHGWEGVSSGKLGRLSEMMVGEYANTVAGKHHLQSLLGENVTYNQLDKDTKKQVDNIFKNHLYASNANQVGGKTTDKLDYHFETDRKASGKNDETAFGTQRLPMHELPVTDNNEVTNQDALNVFGIGNLMNETGNIKYDQKYTVTGSDGTKYTFDDFEAANNARKDLRGTIETNKNAGKPDITKMTQFYTGLLNSAKAVGVKIPKLENGKTDFETLKSQMIEVGRNQLISGDVGQGLQAELATNMTSYYGGDINENGDVKLSSFMETAQIKEAGSNRQITSDEGKRELVKNGTIKDINFYAENPGTVVWTSDDGTNIKDYNVYLGEKVIKELTKPTWELTKSFKDNMTGKVTNEQKVNNYRSETQITKNLYDQYNSISDPKLKEYLIEDVKSKLANTEDYKTTGIKESAERDSKGNSKYIFIGKQTIDANNKPVEKVVVIDRNNGSVDLKDLNEVQAMESGYVQEQISKGYKKKLRKDEE